MNVQELFTSNLSMIDRIIRIVCRRAGVFGADQEDFASQAKLRIIEDDYAVLRKYEGRSSLESYLTIVIQRMLADARISARGRFRASAEAQRLGPIGVLLEKLVLRDGRSLDDAMPHLRAVDPNATRESMTKTLGRLPERSVRPRDVELDGVEEVVAGSEPADARVVASEVRRLAHRAETTLRHQLAMLPAVDRSLIRFHFGEEMTLAEIARVMQLPQRPLYRRLESLLQQLRDALTSAGIDRRTAAELVESEKEEMDFGLREREKRDSSPVHQVEET